MITVIVPDKKRVGTDDIMEALQKNKAGIFVPIPGDVLGYYHLIATEDIRIEAADK